MMTGDLVEPDNEERDLKQPAPKEPDADHVRFTFDGSEVVCRPGQSVAAALWAIGHRSWRRTRGGRPRGLFCGIGLCFDCLATVDGYPAVRLCRLTAAPGMQVEVEGQVEPDV